MVDSVESCGSSLFELSVLIHAGEFGGNNDHSNCTRHIGIELGWQTKVGLPLSSGLLDEEVKRGQWTKLREFELHQLRLAQRQFIQQGARFFDRSDVHEKYGTFLILPAKYSFSVAGTSFGKIALSCSGVGGDVNRPVARILVVGTTGKGRLGFSAVS
jgi:hypothetical protein